MTKEIDLVLDFFFLFYFIVFYWVSCCLAITVIIFAVKFMSIFFIPYSMGSISVRYLFMTIFSFPMYVTFLLGRFEITSAPEQDRYPDRCTCLFIFFFLLSSLFPNSQNSFIESAAVIYWESTFFVVVGGAKSTRRHQQNRLVSVSWMWHGPTSGHRCKTKRKCEPPLFFLGGNQSQKLV